MAHKKAGGSTSLGRDSQGKRLGVKLGDGKPATAGAIIVRQRGTQIRPGQNVGMGVDHTLFAKAAGTVKFTKRQFTRFDGNRKVVSVANVVQKDGNDLSGKVIKTPGISSKVVVTSKGK